MPSTLTTAADSVDAVSVRAAPQAGSLDRDRTV
jgi:hypothetical protein